MAVRVRGWFRCGVEQLGSWHCRWLVNTLGHCSQNIHQPGLIRGGLSLLLLMGAVVIHMPSTYANEVCDALSVESGTLNTDDPPEDGAIIIIGHLPEHNYVVVVPGRRESLLIDVRRYVPDAFMTSSRLGSYVHAGAFENRGDAESLSMQLRACKIRSRVVYFRNGRPV